MAGWLQHNRRMTTQTKTGNGYRVGLYSAAVVLGFLLSFAYVFGR